MLQHKNISCMNHAAKKRGFMDAPSTPAAPSISTPFYLTFLWACNLVWTLILLGMNVAEFFQGGRWTYQGPGSVVYLATLAAYAGVKETHQWNLNPGEDDVKGRRGVLFVGVWLVLCMGAFVTTNLTAGFQYPHELTTITLEVLGIFFGTQASKALRRRRAGKAQIQDTGIEEKILLLANETGGASTALLMDRLGAGRGEVQYALKKMLKAGTLKRVGDDGTDPDTKYVAV
jgi:hypothetical protein